MAIQADETRSPGAGARAPAPLAQVAGLILGLGAVGLFVTTLFYAAAPEAAALPARPFDAASAFSGAVAGAVPMRAAGGVGVFADMLLTTGCALASLDQADRGRASASAGWAALALSSLIFIFVDTLVGFVMPPLALAGERGAFIGAKLLFDALFLLGVMAFGVGSIFALTPERTAPTIARRAPATAGVIVGALATLCALACLAGFPLAKGVGLCVGAGAVVFAVIGMGMGVSGGTGTTRA